MTDKFKCIIDKSLLELFPGNDDSLQNKSLLSYLNGFESGEWRYSHFNKFIFDNMCETALSEEERSKLVGEPLSSLQKAAKNLRISNDTGKGSELAEILLYGVMKHHYKALPVVPKIFYKQNSQDNAKGADSVHIVLEDDGSFSLWYGESKFYTDLWEAMNSAIASIKDTISDSKIRKENSIVTSMSDLKACIKDDAKSEEIKRMLSSDTSLDDIKLILHVPILLLHECKITDKYTCMSQDYLDEMENMYKEKAQRFFVKLSGECKSVSCYESITFHLIPFPIPDKEKVISNFLRKNELLRED